MQLQWLRPLVAPVSSSAPGRGDCPALIPALIIFKAVRIYITLMQAPVALQLPQEAAFLAFLSCLVGRDCYHGRELCSGTTEASGQLVGFGCFPGSDCFSTHTNGLNSGSSATQQGYSVTEIIYPSLRDVCPPCIYLHCQGRS